MFVVVVISEAAVYLSSLIIPNPLIEQLEVIKLENNNRSGILVLIRVINRVLNI